MKSIKITVGGSTISFSVDGIRKRYTDKEVFIEDVTTAHSHIEKKELLKAVDKVWNIAFPKEEKSEVKADKQ